MRDRHETSSQVLEEGNREFSVKVACLDISSTEPFYAIWVRHAMKVFIQKEKPMLCLVVNVFAQYPIISKIS